MNSNGPEPDDERNTSFELQDEVEDLKPGFAYGEEHDDATEKAEDLAEQAVSELEEIEDLDEERAAKLIMAARAHWFENEESA